MSLVPDEERSICQRTELKPTDEKDSPGLWRRFIGGLREHVGMLPLNLVKRWWTAEVVNKEIDGQVNLLNAKANYEKAMAEVRKLDREAEADAELKRAQVEEIRIRNHQALELASANQVDPMEAIERLNMLIEQIRFAGGGVEFQLPLVSLDEIQKAKRAAFDTFGESIIIKLRGAHQKLAEIARDLQDYSIEVVPSWPRLVYQVTCRRLVEALQFQIRSEHMPPGTPFNAVAEVAQDLELLAKHFENQISKSNELYERRHDEQGVRGWYMYAISNSSDQITRFLESYTSE